jgi:hypothetical protein
MDTSVFGSEGLKRFQDRIRSMPDDDSRAKSYGGTAVLLAMVAGVSALVLALTSAKSAHFEASALALLAAGVAFSGIANAIFRQ